MLGRRIAPHHQYDTGSLYRNGHLGEFVQGLYMAATEASARGLVTLGVVVMGALPKDEAWIQWVDGVSE